MKRRHEFLASSLIPTSPYCAVCSLPPGNEIHRARPRSFMVTATTYMLDVDPARPGPRVTQYGPFGTEADAQEFAVTIARQPHRLATVTELSDPAQCITTKK